MPEPIDPRSPCIVGTARATWRDPATTPEPLEMWAETARSAAVDAAEGAATSAGAVLTSIDDVGLVHCQSWYYDRPPDRLVERLGVPAARATESILAGTSPQRLLDGAAVRLLRGETSVALVVGGEALAARRWFRRSGGEPAWSFPHPRPPALPVDLDQWYLPTEIAHGVLPAWLTFALLEQARWAQRGASASGRDDLRTVIERLHRVAAVTPGAWFTDGADVDDLVRPGPGNRMVATPYTKRMTAFLDVDMAAANLMVTHATADRWGVPPERRVYLRGWGFARDEVHLAARRDLGGSPGMRAATSEALARARLGVDDLAVLDLYSCFASAVQFALDGLGLAVTDPRPLTVTGGLPYHGGPGSNYMSHSISHMVDHLRDRPGEAGMVTGVGMHMTKHVAGVWSTRPGPLGPFGPFGPVADHGPQRWAGSGAGDDVAGGAGGDGPGWAVTDRASGPATVVSATVVHDPAGAPWAVAICETDRSTRCYARSDHPDVVAAVDEVGWVGATAHLRSVGPVNVLEL